MSEKIKYKGYKITIEPEEDAENPYTDYDQTTDLVTWHRNYNFNSTQRPDYKQKPNGAGRYPMEAYAPYDSPQEVLDAVASGELVWCAPLYPYEHGGITVSLGSMDYRWPDQQWDCGLLGMVYVTAAKAKAEWPNYGGRVLQYVCQKRAEQEVETFDMYVTGDVWYVKVTRKGKDVESLGWVYGYSEAEKEAKMIVDSDIAYREKRKLAKAHEKVLDQWFGFLPEGSVGIC